MNKSTRSKSPSRPSDGLNVSPGDRGGGNGDILERVKAKRGDGLFALLTRRVVNQMLPKAVTVDV